MAEKTYKCAYTHCIHNGEPVLESASVNDKGKHYHWDCDQMKQDIAQIKKIYTDFIADDVNYGLLGKVINDLIFKEGYEADYIKFIVCYIASNDKRKNSKVKSPFTLSVYAKNGDGLRAKYDKNAQWWFDNFARKGIC